MIFFLIFLGLLTGFLAHGYLASFQMILTNADSFAYLQMSHYIKQLDIQGLGTGWFGFLYSLCIAPVNMLFSDELFSAHFVNIILFFIGGMILYSIAQRYLHYLFSFLLVLLYGLSTPLLYYNVNVLSENLYIPLFLGFFLLIIRFLESEEIKELFYAGIVLGCMYLTRSEAFIYGLPVLIIIIMISFVRKIYFKKFIMLNIAFGVGFFLIASPYIYFLHTITGEWGLTNKGSSNIRQAMMRGVERMDDTGFERAVAELTDDKKSLKSGFVGGLKYAPSDKKYTLQMLIEENPERFKDTWIANVTKLFSQTLPKMLIGDALYYTQEVKVYSSPFYGLFIIWLMFPILFCVYGCMQLYFDRRHFILIVFTALFATASIFFTMFFVLERYFIPFLPIFLIFIVYGIQSFLRNFEKIQIPRSLLLGGIMLGLYGAGMYYYIQNIGKEEEKYLIKKELGLRLKEQIPTLFPDKQQIRIMERFPILTYYAGVKERYITPFASQADIIEYARHNEIDILVVDSLDFKEYRSEHLYLLDPKSILKRKDLEVIPFKVGKKTKDVFQKYGQKVVLYKFNFKK